MNNFTKTYILILAIIIVPTFIYAAASDFLILQDIGSYKFITESKNPLTKKIIQTPGYIMSNNAGVVVGSGHFGLDHTDATYEAYYESDVADLGVKVQVTKHAGSDSDKWLLHEVESGFKDNETLDATYISPNPLRDINGKKIFYTWGYYDWVSNYIVVSIKFNDMTGTKPEPLDVVQAYLQKFPSTIPTTLILNNDHKIQGIKDEMDRRLWLCDKWFMQLQLQKVQQTDAFQAAVKSMNVFLDYREKYYSIKAANEKNLLSGYLNANNGTAIKAKLTEYKTWWGVHKTDAISL